MSVFDGTYYKITTTNYISKTSLYTTFRMYPSGPWPLKILMFALLVTCEIATYSWPWEKTGDGKYMLGLLLILISKSWGCLSLGPGMPFLDNNTCAEGGGVIYLCQGFFPYMMPSMDGWMDGKLHKKQPQRPLLYVIHPRYNALQKGQPFITILLIYPSPSQSGIVIVTLQRDNMLVTWLG